MFAQLKASPLGWQDPPISMWAAQKHPAVARRGFSQHWNAGLSPSSYWTKSSNWGTCNTEQLGLKNSTWWRSLRTLLKWCSKNDFIAVDGSHVFSGSIKGLNSLNSLASESLSNSTRSSSTRGDPAGVVLFIPSGVIPGGTAQGTKKGWKKGICIHGGVPISLPLVVPVPIGVRSMGNHGFGNPSFCKSSTFLAIWRISSNSLIDASSGKFLPSPEATEIGFNITAKRDTSRIVQHTYCAAKRKTEVWECAAGLIGCFPYVRTFSLCLFCLSCKVLYCVCLTRKYQCYIIKSH